MCQRDRTSEKTTVSRSYHLHTKGVRGYTKGMADGAVVSLDQMKRKKDPVQIALRVPPEWLEEAERLALALSRPGLEVTRTEAFRAAIARGLESLTAETAAEKSKKKTGLSGSCRAIKRSEGRGARNTRPSFGCPPTSPRCNVSNLYPSSAQGKAPSVDGPATARSAHLAARPAQATHPLARQLRAAQTLVLAEERQAKLPNLPLASRFHALTEANRHLAQSWVLLNSWASQTAGDPGIARAGDFLGGINRRLPLAAAALRAEAGQPCSFDHEDAPPASGATVPCPPPTPYKVLVAQARTREQVAL